MAIGPREMNEEPPQTASAGTGVGTHDAPARPFIAAASGDRCAACGTPLAGDQRYCVSCGERRGNPRFSVASDPPADHSEGLVSPAPASALVPRSARSSSGATVVAGVGTLLLAMGVGVLIGHNTASPAKQAAAPPPTVVTVNGAASGVTTAAAGATPHHTATHASKSKAGSKSKAKVKSRSKAGAKPTAAEAAKASNAASKVLGSSNSNLPPATVTEGQTGNGPGYNKTSKKFDGSFFGQ